MKRIAIVLFFLLISAPSWATIYYVDIAVGDDGNAGTSQGVDNAWASIGKAMRTVAAGDTVYVKASGEYAAQDGGSGAIGLAITKGTSFLPISFIGYLDTGDLDSGTFASVTLNAGTNSLASCITDGGVGGSYSYYFKNFRFTGGSSYGINFLAGDAIYFYNCRADNNSSTGFRLDNSSSVTNCRADNNAGDGIALDTSGIVSNCTSFNNTSIGISVEVSSSVENCVVYDNLTGQILCINGNCSVSNCTIDGGGVDLGISFRNNGHLAQNCIIYDCTDGIIGNDASPVPSYTSLNNLFFSNDTDKTNWPDDPSDIEADPLFLNADANDYRLRLGSPAIQGGIDAGEIVNGVSYIDVGAHQKSARPLRVRARRHGQ